MGDVNWQACVGGVYAAMPHVIKGLQTAIASAPDKEHLRVHVGRIVNDASPTLYGAVVVDTRKLRLS